MAPSRETSLLLDQVMKGFSMTILVVFLGGDDCFFVADDTDTAGQLAQTSEVIVQQTLQ